MYFKCILMVFLRVFKAFKKPSNKNSFTNDELKDTIHQEKGKRTEQMKATIHQNAFPFRILKTTSNQIMLEIPAKSTEASKPRPIPLTEFLAKGNNLSIPRPFYRPKKKLLDNSSATSKSHLPSLNAMLTSKIPKQSFVVEVSNKKENSKKGKSWNSQLPKSTFLKKNYNLKEWKVIL